MFFVDIVLNYNTLLYLIYEIIGITLASFIIEFILVSDSAKKRQRICIFAIYILILASIYILIFCKSLCGYISTIIIILLLLYLCCKKCDIKSNLSDIKQLSISSLILISAYLGVQLMLEIFNGKSLDFNIDNISRSMEDWGNFATCLTALFALISIYFAYRAFQSQVNASRRSSFDATFTQIFAQHHILYNKVNCVTCSHCHFTGFRVYFLKKLDIREDLKLTDIWKDYNDKLEKQCGQECPINFINFFKFIHREVTYVQDNFQDSWGLESKKKYVRLIEGQLNNDELFSYFVNQLEYCERHWDKKRDELEKYLEFLKANDFFKEICEETSFGYRKYVQKALNLLDQKYRENISNAIINEEWFRS